MITVKIYSIMFDSEYEFTLDSDAPVSELAEEIGEVICQKEQCSLRGKPEQLMMYSIDRGCVLSASSTLMECGVKTGDTLYFG